MPSGFSSDELDKMKADAIRRARQMHSRSSIPPLQDKTRKPQKSDTQNSSVPSKKQNSLNNLFGMLKLFKTDNDQLIILVLILLLYGDKQNMPLILALLYIAM